MPRRSALIIFLILTMHPVSGQVRGILGLPDRIMSSSRIGRVSTRSLPQVPQADSGRIVFPVAGKESVSKDFDFFNYLLDNDLGLDARTLASRPYSASDTLDFMRAKVLFSEKKLSQAAELFGSVPSDSPFGPESFFYKVVSLSSLGEYETAAGMLPYEGGPYAELSALQKAGLSLLMGKEDEWIRSSAAFGYEDYTLAESERVLSEIVSTRFSPSRKRPGVATLASAVVPGAGKIYAGRLGEGIAAFLTVGSLGAITAENWKKHGGEDWRTIVAGTLCATFYLGNIYGSYMSVSIERDERMAAENTLILYHLHLPLRSIFR